MEIDVQIRGLDQMVKRNDAIYQDLQSELFSELRAIAGETAQMAVAAAPVFTGALRAGIKTRSSRQAGILTATVRARAPHSSIVQHGRRPGKMPSIDPTHAANPKSAQRLLDWAKAHGMDPFLLARSIARRGTRGHPFMPSQSQAQQLLEARIPSAVERVLERHKEQP